MLLTLRLKAAAVVVAVLAAAAAAAAERATLRCRVLELSFRVFIEFRGSACRVKVSLVF